MLLSKTQQTEFIRYIGRSIEDYTESAGYEMLEFVYDFDIHSPCENLCVVSPKGVEIKVFAPNSTTMDFDNEKYNTINLYFDDGYTVDDTPLEFDNVEGVCGYIVEQLENDNI